MSLYNLKSADGDQFRCTKFNSDLEPESSYLVSNEACECPQFVNRDKKCRHMKMLKYFLRGPTIRLDTHWFYDYDHDAWFSHQSEKVAETDDGRDIVVHGKMESNPKPTEPKSTAPSWRRI